MEMDTHTQNMSATPLLKDEEDEQMALASSPGAATNDENDTPEAAKDAENALENDKKRLKTGKTGVTAPPKKPSEEVLQRRREGRLKAAATMAQNLKKSGIGRFEDENGFALTSVKAIPLINQKNYFAEYLKREDQVTLIRNWRNEKQRDVAPKSAGLETRKQPDYEDDDDDEDNDNDDGSAKAGDDTIVLQPGSQFMRIGRATDSFPTKVPMVVAIPDLHPSKEYPVVPERVNYEDGDYDFGEKFAAAKNAVTKDFKARMRYYKRRMMPNSRESAANFNRTQKPEVVPHNSDPDYREFFERDDPLLQSRDFFAGDDALRIPLSEDYTKWRLRFPIINGTLNQEQEDYKSQQEFICDLCRVTCEALKAINVPASEVAKYKCLLLIPDFYDKEVIEAWCDILLRSVGFGRVGVIQEAVAATFGSGSSCACVVDVGAQKTTISCVDEGLVINDSRVSLDYGGDNITETFTKLLLQQNFPIQDLNLHNHNDDWELADRLKRTFGTFDDADIAVQLYNFYRRKAGSNTEKYTIKVFDEVMLAPLGLFHPDLFQLSQRTRSKGLFPESYDHYTGEPNNPFSQAQENLVNGKGYTELTDENLLMKIIEDKQIFKAANAAYGKPVPNRAASTEDSRKSFAVPLDKAIIESITNAGIATDFNRAKKLYDNILVVGGGLAKFPGYDALLNDRINIWRPRFLSTSTLDDILSYVGKEKDRLDAKKKQMITDLKASKKDASSTEEVELSEQELKKIEADTKLTIDLQKADAVADDGSVIPVNVLPAPKELDPQLITWKGGSVYGRLKVANEMWITRDDWDTLNSRCLYYKTLFNY
ncbi:hypothetical protein OXX80_005632 [Metschnikowia pulcherrima]